MTHRLTSIYAKNYCNRTLIVKVIIENVVTCFFEGHSVYLYKIRGIKDSHVAAYHLLLRPTLSEHHRIGGVICGV